MSSCPRYIMGDESHDVCNSVWVRSIKGHFLMGMTALIVTSLISASSDPTFLYLTDLWLGSRGH